MTSHAFSVEAEERRFLAAAKAISSWSMPIRRPPSPSRLATSEECPAPPSVESTNVCCGLRFKCSGTRQTGPVYACIGLSFLPRQNSLRIEQASRSCSPAGFHDAWYPQMSKWLPAPTKVTSLSMPARSRKLCTQVMRPAGPWSPESHCHEGCYSATCHCSRLLGSKPPRFQTGVDPYVESFVGIHRRNSFRASGTTTIWVSSVRSLRIDDGKTDAPWHRAYDDIRH